MKKIGVDVEKIPEPIHGGHVNSSSMSGTAMTVISRGEKRQMTTPIIPAWARHWKFTRTSDLGIAIDKSVTTDEDALM